MSGRMRSVKQGGTAGDIHALVPTGNCVGTGVFFYAHVPESAAENRTGLRTRTGRCDRFE